MTKPLPNFSRMLTLIDEVFDTRNDKDQIQVDQKIIKRLAKIHPSTLSELANENGPICWILMIPTTTPVMNDFINGKISENEILKRTNSGEAYDCIYLCSATTLPEFRGKGSTKELCLSAIRAICKEHIIKTLFVWPFTKEGETLANAVSKESGLPVLKKK